MASPENIIETASKLSIVLKKAGIAHAIIGGAAGNLLGSERSTQDVDVLVTPPAIQVREAILRNSDRFTVAPNMKLVHTSESGTIVPIEILKDGPEATLRMPELSSTPILEVDQIPVVHPSMLICMKLNRWSWMSESTRDQSRVKADNDRHDIMFMLHWLAEKGEKITFEGVEVDRRERHMEGLRKLRSEYEEADELLKSVLD
ncbi:hypothetical protein TWF281_009213 [Arthrobotrys megalospora]